MLDPRLEEEFEKMDAKQLRHLLKLVCDEKSFTLKHHRGKITVKPGKVFIMPAGFHDGKFKESNFRDCENYEEGDEEDGIEVEDVPSKSKIEIQKLVRSNKRKYPGYSSNMFMCEICHNEFCIYNNPSNDCLWHTGQRTTDLDDVIWADHNYEKHGAIEDRIDHHDLEDRWIWSCCGEMGSDWGCKITRHKVLEGFEEFNSSSDVASGDLSDESKKLDEDLDSSGDLSENWEDIEEPTAKRVKQ
ncbi:df374279-07a2-4d83-be28-6c6e0719400a [Sclerotinia trifoliorum]|uniref:Df374279-07a2-4d83-be28-6c6e0719400a n=1 Tax=Sclerotinia trifoliorum TaxID=28548 RepID=A0A8H2ZSX9_9HELO|nr:df374279-07a2-4d83-be28-6c6e0719400a [Sclerotinia trifoliorum]